MSCNLAHKCSGFHDMGALAVAADAAASEGAKEDARLILDRFYRLRNDGVPCQLADLNAMQDIRIWVNGGIG